MPKKKILIVTDDAGESYEILYAKHRFEEAGFVAHIAATEKKRLNGVIHEFYPGWNTYIEKPGYLIQADIARMKTYYGNRGYAVGIEEQQFAVPDRPGFVDVVYKIHEPGPRDPETILRTSHQVGTRLAGGRPENVVNPEVL